MKIGIFDSGIGGLSLLHQAMITLPEVDYVFYADVDNVPYGEKTNEQIREYVDKAVGFLVEKGCKAVVLACNTATSAAITYLRNKYQLPIIGIEPAVKPACQHNRNKRIMVVATPVTSKGVKLKNLIMKYDINHKVDVVALPMLNNEFAGYNFGDYSELVLGCTHFNYFKDSFAKLFPSDIEIIDGNIGVSNNLKNTLIKNGIIDGEHNSNERGKVEYYYSGRAVDDAELSHIKELHKRLEVMRKI